MYLLRRERAIEREDSPIITGFNLPFRAISRSLGTGHWLFNCEGEKMGSSCQITQGSREGSSRSPTEALMNRSVLKVGPWTSEHTENSPDVDTSLLQASSNPTESFVWIRTTQPLPIVQMSLHKRSRYERNLVDTFLIKQLVTWVPLRDFGHSTNMKSLL